MQIIDKRQPKIDARDGDFVKFKEEDSNFFCKITHNCGQAYDVVDLETGDRLGFQEVNPHALMFALSGRYTDIEVIPHEKVEITISD
jgi:hypothetical protein